MGGAFVNGDMADPTRGAFQTIIAFLPVGTCGSLALINRVALRIYKISPNIVVERHTKSVLYHVITAIPHKIKRPSEGGLFSVPNQLTNAADSGQIS